MKLTSIDQIKSPLVTPAGEVIFELVGQGESAGEISSHSLAQIQIPPGKSSSFHYHKVSEETYFILEGQGWMSLDGREFTLNPGQAILIQPGEIHQICNQGEKELKFLAICVPAWVPEDSFEVED
jgi:mannose-6-phosphate isomerase-like protein (cupin superfamily)